ncbi:hypothetical protein GF351_02480 [Candidatus Woesearchaeota archaeon]|nr:hypothetical protein [Candidatus Woesearchaeota archaeon]
MNILSHRPTISVFYNFRAGKASLQERDAIYAKARTGCRQAGYNLCFKDMLELDINFYQDIGNAVSMDPEHIIIVGGDGTVQTTLTQIIKEYRKKRKDIPPLLVCPSGTMNDLATSLGMFSLLDPNLGSMIAFGYSTKSGRILERYLQGLKEGSYDIREFPVLKVTADQGGSDAGTERGGAQEQYGSQEKHGSQEQYGFIIATGPVVKLMKIYESRILKGDFRGKSLRGQLNAVGSALTTIGIGYSAAQLLNSRCPGNLYQRTQGALEVTDEDGYQHIVHDPLMTVVSTLPRLGFLKAPVFHRLIEQDSSYREGSFSHAIAVAAEPRSISAWKILKALSGRLEESEDFPMFESRSLSFELEEPMEYLIDAQFTYPVYEGRVRQAPMRAENSLEVMVDDQRLKFIRV